MPNTTSSIDYLIRFSSCIEQDSTAEVNFKSPVSLELISTQQIPSLRQLDAKRSEIALFLTLYSEQLTTTNRLFFIYLDEHQKKYWRERLIITFNLYCLSFYLNLYESRYHLLADHFDGMLSCQSLLAELDANAKSSLSQLSGKIKQDFEATRWQFSSYLPVALQRYIHGITPHLIWLMDETNNLRLYWVWAVGMLFELLELLPGDYPNKATIIDVLSVPTLVGGYMSWILYFIRFSFYALLMAKHVFEHGSMHDEEKQLEKQKRSDLQWDIRKYRLLNDSLWGVANMICFFWLNGKDILNYLANVLTVVLLVMDFVLSLVYLSEQEAARREDIEKLEALFNQVKNRVDENNEILRHIHLQRKFNLQRTQVNHKYQRLRDLANTGYAGGLLLAFCVASAFFLPPFAFTPIHFTIISFVGASLCFTANALLNIALGFIDIKQAYGQIQQVENECVDYLNCYNKLTTDSAKKVLFMQMQGLLAEKKHLERVVFYQQCKLVRSVLVDILIPPVLHIALSSLALSSALWVIGGFMALAFITYVMVQILKPEFESKTLPEDTQGFAAFEQIPAQKRTLSDLKSNHYSFFILPKSPPQGQAYAALSPGLY